MPLSAERVDWFAKVVFFSRAFLLSMRAIASHRLVATALQIASLVRSLAAIVVPTVGAAMFPWVTFCASRVDFAWWMMLLSL